ncbi:hypothetical protein Golob_026816, partial [Gossypium lobatum]|nr:hypothetical protein [Gossypium lobatum]
MSPPQRKQTNNFLLQRNDKIFRWNGAYT